ncbi:MAG: LysM peptidoglycan-binding domain-containing protein [Ekhidna sp.]|nr:LysM peptidoglycan-binding domain-containing protein [Ekhidna sp.]
MKTDHRGLTTTAGSIKIRKLLIIILWIFYPVFGIAQQVPGEMMIGDLKLHINESARKQIQQEVDRLKRSPAYFDILVDRMNLYFPFIEREHRKRGVPDQIKFLAIQESALISDAVSSANAVGFWQFKDFTGREVGLQVDRKVDERLNIVSSSGGSAEYFKTNNFYFDNWAYAVIAYQAGAAGAKKHINEKYYGAKKLNITKNTYWYLKKFIAHVVAFTPSVGLPHAEGIWLDEVTNAGGKSLEQIAKEHKVDIEELKKYNKWLKKGRVPTDKTYSVLIPKTGSRPENTIASNNNVRLKKKKPEEKIYPTEIKPGISKSDRVTIITLNGIPAILSGDSDNIHSISARAEISENKFRKYNDMFLGDRIEPNEFYYIKKKKRKSKVGIHIVQKGETLWEVSRKYGIRLKKLAKKNRISMIDPLKEGRVLWMDKTRPAGEPAAYYKVEDTKEVKDESEADTEEIKPIEVPYVDSSAERRKVKIHTVAKGESLWSISRLYEIKVDDILRWNELPDPNAINIGQNIQVKAPIEEASAGKSIITHTVKSGETMYAISRKYGMTVDEIMDLNEMETFNLNAGQELKVYGED